MKIKSLIKNKKAQGLFGLPYTIIFSVILIVFFIIAAFIAIDFFMDYNKKVQIGFFYDDFQAKLNEAWNSQSSSFNFESSLPSSIEFVCFINMTNPVSGEASFIEKELFPEIKYGPSDTNFVIYPTGKALGHSHRKMDNMKIPEQNPYCLEVNNGLVKIKIEKTFEEALPRVS